MSGRTRAMVEKAARAAAKFVRQALNDSTFSNAARKVSDVYKRQMIIIIKAFIILWRMIWIRHWLRKYSRPWQHLRPIAFSLCRRTAVLRLSLIHIYNAPLTPQGSAPLQLSQPHHTAYIIFTSGSTGRPRRRARAFAVSSSAPPPTPITTLRSSPDSAASCCTSLSLQ